MDIVLVYLGHSIFHDTVPRAHKKVNKHDVNDHELVHEVNDHDDDSFMRHMRSMGHATISIAPSPSPSPVTKPKKCKHKKEIQDQNH